MEIFENGQWLPLTFALLMAVAVLVYAVLDGYDLGVGILMRLATPAEQDTMIASIGPFWDANETWLVLAVGLLLIAFPQANGIVLGHLYVPTFLMLIGLILRGVSFDFRAKAKVEHKERWNLAFTGGSFLVAITQGYMVGAYILGFEYGLFPLLFCLMTGLFVAAAYSLIGACWLIMKTEGELQKKAIAWAGTAVKGTTAGIALVSIATPLVSAHVFARWTTFPDLLILAPLPLIVIGLTVWLNSSLRCLQQEPCVKQWMPFAMTAGLYVTSLIALAYSFYPYIVPGQLKIVDAASAPESLMFILVGALIVLPFLFGYTFYAYKVFHGKAKELSYD
ncbi:MAG TPA: cytochrome BD ubiquinol oxidase subunit II [Rhodospirillaceae bacterium]|nr:cytochrome BD ubiquinol oxidase subunit II [Rhodospirillaceae bacterium]